MEQDKLDIYRQNRAQSYATALRNQINNSTKARVESDLTIRAHETFMSNYQHEKGKQAWEEEMDKRTNDML